MNSERRALWIVMFSAVGVLLRSMLYLSPSVLQENAINIAIILSVAGFVISIGAPAQAANADKNRT